MDIISKVVLVTALFTVIRNTEGTICKTDSDCGSGECCYIKPDFEVVSRRRQATILPVLPNHHDTGVCEKFKLEHDPCWPLATANGHCGCGAGMACQFVPAKETIQPLIVSRKRDIYMPGPGSFQCETKS